MITVIVFSLISFIRFTPGTPYNPSKSVQKIPAWKPDTPTIDTLPQLRVYRDWISLSGFSSGGTFAQQLLVSHSSKFVGVAVFSHGYYRCGKGDGDPVAFDRVCTRIGKANQNEYYDPNLAIRDIQSYYERGLIEDPKLLQKKRLYVYTGTNNFLFTTDQSLRIVNVFGPFMKPESIRTVVQAANFTLPSDSFGGVCASDARSNFYISNCGLSGSYEALTFLLKPGHIAKPQKRNLESLRKFNQQEFFPNKDVFHSMDSEGFYYIPAKCQLNFGRERAKTCLLHFYFHGCFTGREFVGENHIKNSGYLELAEENGIIMIFPQVRSSERSRIGCWDTFGATGPLYATQKGVQLNIVYKMLQRIAGF